MRYFRATLLIGGGVLALVWALETWGALQPWTAALLSFAGIPESAVALPQPLVIGLCALAALGCVWTTVDISKPALKGVVAGCALLQVATLVYVLGLFGWAFPAIPIGLCLVLGYLTGLLYSSSEAGRRKRLLQAVLGTRVSVANLRRLVDGEHALPLNGTRAAVVVLVCEFLHPDDPAEAAEPDHRLRAINRFLDRASELLAERGGYVDQCSGEGLRALFLPPITPGNPSVAALDAARELTKLPDQELDFRIGLERDEAALGVMGSRRLGAFGATGPVLDWTRRIARWNFRFGTRLLAGPGIHAEAGSACRFRPAVLVPPATGSPAAEIYEVLEADSESIDDSLRQARSLYWEGVVLFRERRWHDALSRLTQARDLAGPDPLCDFYLARARAALGGDGRAADPFSAVSFPS